MCNQSSKKLRWKEINEQRKIQINSTIFCKILVAFVNILFCFLLVISQNEKKHNEWIDIL